MYASMKMGLERGRVDLSVFKMYILDNSRKK